MCIGEFRPVERFGGWSGLRSSGMGDAMLGRDLKFATFCCPL